MAIHVVTGAFQGAEGQWLAETLCGEVVPEGEPIGEAEAGSNLCKICKSHQAQVVADRHCHRDPWDKAREQAHDEAVSVGLRGEAKVLIWTHYHSHSPGHENVLMLDHRRAPDGEMIE